ncbi:unnamed protein product [Linum tenue]|uniref:Uncharacterized protein n=2 Tax=Linum tenue TaxID=586396 RepID=A0AAV0QSD5_9ROSI|nr:unnamed protein product [Linum tenue]
MVRGKVELRRIENAASRQVTFSKRRSGLMKKARELSVLCDAEIAVIVFSQRGRLSEFSNHEMQKTIARYQKHAGVVGVDKRDTDYYCIQQLKQESASMAKKIEQLEASRRKLLGEQLGSCSLEEIRNLGEQLERSLANIRLRKDEMVMEQMKQLRLQERELLRQKATLCEKCSENIPREPSRRAGTGNEVAAAATGTAAAGSSVGLSNESSTVETTLSIGLPTAPRWDLN